jgi:hypothetical protein
VHAYRRVRPSGETAPGSLAVTTLVGRHALSAADECAYDGTTRAQSQVGAQSSRSVFWREFNSLIGQAG